MCVFLPRYSFTSYSFLPPSVPFFFSLILILFPTLRFKGLYRNFRVSYNFSFTNLTEFVFILQTRVIIQSV